MEVVIRTATIDDAPELARLRWNFSEKPDTDDFSFEDFKGLFETFLAKTLHGRWRVWVAENNGQLIGNMWLQLVEKVPRPGDSPTHLGYLTNVYIKTGTVDRAWGSRC